jgi:hypothetical protein
MLRGCAADCRNHITKQCFCEGRCPVSLNRRKIAANSRLKGASWSKFEEFADEFAAIRAAEFAEKLHQKSAAQPLLSAHHNARVNNYPKKTDALLCKYRQSHGGCERSLLTDLFVSFVAVATKLGILFVLQSVTALQEYPHERLARQCRINGSPK